MYLIISTSLNPSSRSRVLAREMRTRIAAHTDQLQFYDLQDVDLPLCDGGACYGDAEVQRLGELVRSASGIIMATPVYNYDVSATAKNVVELTGKAWTDTVVGFVCAAGGGVSYMAVMGIANSLMLDFRSFVLPKFVFATGEAFDDENRVIDDDVARRLDELASSLVRVAEALHPKGERAENVQTSFVPA